MAFCTNCGAQVPDNASYCASCGKAMIDPAARTAAAAPSPATTPIGGALADNVAGMLAYVTFIPAILFLVLEPYNRNRFVRFHAFQCIFLCIALFAIHVVLMWIPLLGPALSMLVSLAALGLWIVLLIKAYGGLMFKVPVVGDLAEKQANAL